MSNDFDVITGNGVPRPPGIKPTSPPALEPRRSGAADKMAAVPKEPRGAK